MSDCVREMTEIERNEYLINIIENSSCPLLLHQWEKDHIKSTLKSNISFLTYARNIGYQPTKEAINNIPPNTGSSVQNKSYQSNMIDSSTRTKLAKLAEYETLEEQGLLFKLPCKIGDTLYDIYEFIENRSAPVIMEYEVESIEIEKDKHGYYFTIGSTFFRPEDFGKTVFTDKKEAEKQLQPPYITDEEFVDYTRGDKP